MTEKQWNKRINEELIHCGIEYSMSSSIIETLVTILVQRDHIYNQYINEGEKPIIEKRKNPLLILWDDLNKTALAYWRELGLTPSSLKRINEGAVKQPKLNKLDEMIKKFDA